MTSVLPTSVKHLIDHDQLSDFLKQNKILKRDFVSLFKPSEKDEKKMTKISLVDIKRQAEPKPVKPKKVLTEEQKQKLRDQLVKARAVKAQKKVVANVPH